MGFFRVLCHLDRSYVLQHVLVRCGCHGCDHDHACVHDVCVRGAYDHDAYGHGVCVRGAYDHDFCAHDACARDVCGHDACCKVAYDHDVYGHGAYGHGAYGHHESRDHALNGRGHEDIHLLQNDHGQVGISDLANVHEHRLYAVSILV